MNNAIDLATHLLGLDSFVVLAAERIAGELVLLVETTTAQAWCRECGARAESKGRVRVQVRDLPIAGRPARLVWRKRVWRCPEPVCPRGSWRERHPGVRSRQVLTERARQEACRRVGAAGDAVAEVARDLGVGWHTVMGAVREHGTPLVEDPARVQGVRALGLDESSFRRGAWWQPTAYVTAFVDLDAGRLLEVAENRTSEAVSAWLAAQSSAWRAGVEVAAIDPYQGYASALRRALPTAAVVIDRFHAIRLHNQALDEVRRRVQQQTLGHRGRKDEPLYQIRRLLLVPVDRLDERALARIDAALADGDPGFEVACAWAATQLLHEVYRAEGLEDGRARLDEWFDWVARVEVPELDRLARTFRRWRRQILAFHTTRLSNGPTEAMNLLIKKIKRVGHGFRDFDNYRLRLLLHCGVQWNTPPTAKIRGRTPSLAA